MQVDSAALVVTLDPSQHVCVENVQNFFALVVGQVSLRRERAGCLLQEIHELYIVFLVKFTFFNLLYKFLNIRYIALINIALLFLHCRRKQSSRYHHISCEKGGLAWFGEVTV